jgi:2-succinyl-5-enolpyruvyl-6-hydroxy-3-cyclohexene-1-carboxylate synthase
VAAGLLESAGLQLHTAIDERSAAFFALGLGRAEGMPAAVITTSGSAVAQLLPACVEADFGAIPLLLLSADRPDRLKGCGANQSVNQETFLQGSCRWVGHGEGAGLALMEPDWLEGLARRGLRHALGEPGSVPPGPVHLNLPFEEPLHADAATLIALARALGAGEPLLPRPLTGSDARARPPLSRSADGPPSPAPAFLEQGPPPVATTPTTRPAAEPAGADSFEALHPSSNPAGLTADRIRSGSALLDPDRPGVVVAGPWRGAPGRWGGHLAALIRWQRRTGWPVLADPLSGLRGQPGLETVAGYDLLLEVPRPSLRAAQVLRLGPLPASRRLERWLAGLSGPQLLVSEGDPRPLDPLARVVLQLPCGLETWLALQPAILEGGPGSEALRHRQAWQRAEAGVQALLVPLLGADTDPAPPWSEPALARQLSRLLPAGLPLMLANSSPVRDWESFADPAGPARPVFGFRGASGIDGTLSEACGLAETLGACVLVSGDLALLHDCNGWLWRARLRGRLAVVLIDNGGGGIFEQLPIRAGDQFPLDFERLFAMPQPVDPLALAAVHGVPARRVAAPADLPGDLAWALAQPFSLLLVATDRQADAALRRRLRTMASQLPAP